jgi:hypothetical protein
LGESESLNLYSYCHNDPVNRVDVLGLAEVPVDMMDKYIQDKLIEEAHLELLEVISSKDDSWLPDAERIERQNIRVNLLLSCQYQLYQSNRQATWISPSNDRPIVETAALCVGGATNQISASLNSMFINPIGAEMFALKGLGGIVGIAAKEARLSATFGKAMGQIQKVIVVANIAKELETGAMLAKADAAFMQTPEVRQLLSASMSPVRPIAQFVSTPSRAQLVAAKSKTYQIIPYSGQLTPNSWPENRGFLAIPSTTTLQPGSVFDRYGSRFGTFVAKEGTPFPMRGLPEDNLRYEPESYRVRHSFDVKSGLTAPAFGQPGLGIQYELPFTVDELIRLRMIEPITR